LLDNALDYLLSAAEHARSDRPGNLKYALLHLAAGVELLLKARLEKEHWSLLFADVDKAAQDRLRSGDFRSVDFETASSRLQSIAEVTISDPARRHLDQLRRLRNQVQHFTVDLELGQVKSLLVHGANFFLDFLGSNLADEMAGREELLETIHEQLREVEDFVKARLATVEGDLADAADVIECPVCWQDTLVIGRGDPHCPFCGFSRSAKDMSEYIGEGAIDDKCLSCGERTLSFVLYHNELGVDWCMTCGTRQTMCPECGRVSVGEHEVCPECGYSR